MSLNKALEKKAVLQEKLTPGNVTRDEVCRAMNEIMPEGKKVSGETVEKIFSGVGKGLAYAKEAEGRDINQMIKESVAKRLGSYDEEERNEEIGKLREELDMPESTEEELVEKTCEVIVKNVHETADKAREVMGKMYESVFEEEGKNPKNEWSAAEKSVIDAAAAFVQSVEDGKEAENAELLGCCAGIHEHVAKNVEEKGGSKILEKIGLLIEAVIGIAIVCAMVEGYVKVAELIVAIPAIEAMGTAGLLIGAGWPLILGLVLAIIGMGVIALRERIEKKQKQTDSIERINRNVGGMHGDEEEENGVFVYA